jgi:hypothetical protein
MSRRTRWILLGVACILAGFFLGLAIFGRGEWGFLGVLAGFFGLAVKPEPEIPEVEQRVATAKREVAVAQERAKEAAREVSVDVAEAATGRDRPRTARRVLDYLRSANRAGK